MKHVIQMDLREIRNKNIVVFDGICNFCSGWVKFFLKKQRAPLLYFASYQSDLGKKITARCGLEAQDPDTMIFVQGNRAYFRSDAVVQLAPFLKGPWKLLYILCLVPRPIREYLYKKFAQNRYRWFGRNESCFLPSPEERKRILS